MKERNERENGIGSERRDGYKYFGCHMPRTLLSKIANLYHYFFGKNIPITEYKHSTYSLGFYVTQEAMDALNYNAIVKKL